MLWKKEDFYHDENFDILEILLFLSKFLETIDYGLALKRMLRLRTCHVRRGESLLSLKQNLQEQIYNQTIDALVDNGDTSSNISLSVPSEIILNNEEWEDLLKFRGGEFLSALKLITNTAKSLIVEEDGHIIRGITIDHNAKELLINMEF
jgi:hypothetical protein